MLQAIVVGDHAWPALVHTLPSGGWVATLPDWKGLTGDGDAPCEALQDVARKLRARLERAVLRARAEC